MHSTNYQVIRSTRKHSFRSDGERSRRNSNTQASDADDELETVPPVVPGQQLLLEPDNVQRELPTLLINDEPTIIPLHILNRMRRRLKFYFMNPIEKWQARRQFPWKLLIQVIKIIVITVQIMLFGSTRYSHINFYNDNAISLSHLFLKNWDATREVTSYPPAQGAYAVYTKAEFYDHIDFAVKRYGSVRKVAIGAYDYEKVDGSIGNLSLCKTFYKEGVIFGFNESYIFDSASETDCLDIIPVTPVNGSVWDDFSSKLYLLKNNFSIKFDRLIRVELRFALTSILLKAVKPFESPDCFRFNISIGYDNQNHDGQLRIELNLKPFGLSCHGNNINGDSHYFEVMMLSILNIFIIINCTLSLFLCCRAIYRAQMLKIETVEFFKRNLKKDLTVNEKLEFWNFWYIMIIINDILIIIGSCIKIQIENKTTDGDLYNACSLLLGSGTLLVWFGLLRYLSFFPKYNILILTMRRAAPDVLRFLLCALLIYAGFVFSGWLILGPYHIKFRNLSTTSECLFALINGDDMFATFSITSDKSELVWWYSRVYCYTFIALFIYLVLSLFIAVIMDTYETIKAFYETGFPKTDLSEFIDRFEEDLNSGSYMHDRTTWKEFFQSWNICSWFRSKYERVSTEDYEPI